MRALAAWTVVAIHLNVVPHLPVRMRGLVEPVPVFFVLSGFLVTSHLLRERTETGRVSLARFGRNRALRILPVYLVFLAIVAIEMRTDWLGWATITGHHFAYAAGGISNFLPRPYYSGHLGATWALAVEAQFYLAWPLVVAVAWRWRVMAAVWIFAACVGARFYILWTSDEVLTLRWTLPAADALMLGCLVAFWHQQRRPRTRTRARTISYALTGLALCSAPTLTIGNETLATMAKYSLFVGFAVLVSWIADNQQSPIVSVLEFRPLRFFGTISFSIYVWQGFWISTGPADQIHWVQRFPQAIPIIATTAALSWYVVERPFLRLRARRLPGNAPRRRWVAPVG